MSSTTTRRALLAGIGALAAAGGAYWYARAPQGPTDAGDARIDLWSQRFPRPEGGELVMAELRGKPLLVNFWATWCAPCVRELPEIDRFARGHAAQLTVVGLAIDRPEPVQSFLKTLPLGFGVGLAGLSGTDQTRNLGNASGALPFTVLLDADGRIVQRKLGETQHDELVGWVKKL